MISEIHMAAVASYKEETKLATDKKINLIFGLNGTGKSTLSNFLYEPSAPEFSHCRCVPEGSDPILVYSQKFIQDNFYVADSLKGIFSLSKENKAAEEKIVAAEAAIADLNQRLESGRARKLNVSQDFNKQKQQAIDEVWKIKTAYSGGDRVLEYCLKGLMGQKDKLFSHLVTIQKPTSEPERAIKQIKVEVEALKGDTAQPQPMLPTLEFNIHEVESGQLFGKSVVGNDNSTVAGLIEKLGNSDWVKRGLEYIPEHVPPNGEPCPFCQETTITPKLAESIRGYFDGAYQADINQIEAMRERYSKARSALIGLDSYTNHQFAEGKITSIAKKYQSLTEILDRNITTIETKLKNPGSVQKLKDSTQAVELFNEEIGSVNAGIQAYNEKLKHRDQTLEALKDEFWSLMRWQYDQTINRYQRDLASTNSTLTEIDAEIKQIESSVAVEKNRIEKAQKETVNVDEAVNAVNSGLLDLGIDDLKIAKHSEILYRVVRSSDSKDAFHTLSEGEKMMISFLYFCELCKGRQSATDTETTKIAVIDDPISSLSHVFIFNVGQLIRNVFFRSDRFSQVFILTHSLYFFYELTDPNHERRKLTQNLYRMTKSPSGSKIHEMKYEEIQNDYRLIVKNRGQIPVSAYIRENWDLTPAFSGAFHQGHSITYRIAVGPQAGCKVFTLQTLPACDPEDQVGDTVGKVAGFSLHAGVAARANERQKLERLCRYISRPAVSEKRLSLTPNGNVRYQLKTPYKDGTTHVIFEPLDFIARLGALVPKPRVNLTRFHNGVFAPNSKHRALVTP